MKYKHKNNLALKKYFFCLFSVIALIFVVATSNIKHTIVASNINTVKAIEASRIIKLETVKEKDEEVDYTEIYNPSDLELNNGNFIEFQGTIKGYGLNENQSLACNESSKIVNNIYYKDSNYGKIRILASDNNIPCGSIIKVSIPNKNTFYGIVLDREVSAIDFNLELLFENQSIANYLGKYNDINYKIVRWGY